MENLVDFFEKETNKKINILKYDNQGLNNNQKLITFNNNVYIIEINDKFSLNNLNGYFYVIYQQNLEFESLKGVLDNLYEDINIFEYDKYVILNSTKKLDVDFSTPEVIESETYRSTYIVYLGVINDVNIFNFKISILNEISPILNTGININKFITPNDLIIYKTIFSIKNEKFIYDLINFENIKNTDENLLQTGLCFIENDLNIAKTSSSLFLHRNTLIYRLEKIKEILGLDLRTFKDSFVFYISIKSYFSSKL